MKFCKLLERVIEVSDPCWAPFWMSYKVLKKELKIVAARASPGRPGSPRNIRESAEETAFFRRVMLELRKVSAFFNESERLLQLCLRRVQAGVLHAKSSGAVDSSHNPALLACKSLYMELLMLENFAVMNHCAFSKILKKHDKVTGFETRGKFMQRVVGKQRFTQHAGLVEMLQSCEDLYFQAQDITTVAQRNPDAAGASEREGMNALLSLSRSPRGLPDPEGGESAKQTDVPRRGTKT